ncbi:MAG: S-adenosylmethionine decarboxylase [Dehalococcoidia bacterium]|jgi:S-adenosylmethionine decarboxylase|nr:S-adenosylmethionine decarboxylase [Dehalococcoidia bacterium]MDW8008053.1 S-adenosylmethionine decarboxylase [Chloroflexota bacterium]
MHLVIDGLGGDPQLLADASLVQEMLEVYPDMLGMNKICPPVVVRYQGPVPEDWGISGVVMIAESHIAIHTFPERGMIWADIFSCRPFEAGPVLEDLRRRFDLKELDVQELRRGLEYLQPSPQRQTISG